MHQLPARLRAAAHTIIRVMSITEKDWHYWGVILLYTLEQGVCYNDPLTTVHFLQHWQIGDSTVSS